MERFVYYVYEPTVFIIAGGSRDETWLMENTYVYSSIESIYRDVASHPRRGKSVMYIRIYHNANTEDDREPVLLADGTRKLVSLLVLCVIYTLIVYTSLSRCTEQSPGPPPHSPSGFSFPLVAIYTYISQALIHDSLCIQKLGLRTPRGLLYVSPLPWYIYVPL